MSPQMEAAIAQGPPYPPMTATPGGIPTVSVDVPTDAVLLFLYICFAAANMTIFQLNRRRGIKFIPSALLFGFCMSRILTMALRISWATEQHNASLALAAQIFVNAGILIVYIINALFAQRILRALQPQVGWHAAFRIGFRIAYFLIACGLILLITFIVYGSYTLSESFHKAQLWTLRAASLYFFIFSLIPLVLVPIAWVLPHAENAETFGHGGMVTKTAILLTGSVLASMIAGFRMGSIWAPARPISNPPWNDKKPAFYCFSFMLEILILILYTSSSIDKRFHVPNGSSKRKTYQEQERAGSQRMAEQTDSELEKQDPDGERPSISRTA